MAARKPSRQYHIGLARGDVAPFILLCGDPDRAAKIAARLEKVRGPWRNREFVTYTGRRGAAEITVMGTGIGPDNTEIAVLELSRCVRNPTLIRVGSCGALRPEVRLGDLVISTGSVRLENTSTYFVPEGYPAVADYRVVAALAGACRKLGARHHVGLTASASGFYGAQGRDVPGFPPRRRDIPAELGRLRVLNMEMETSALFTLASVAGFRAGAVCAVYAQRVHGGFIAGRAKARAESDAIEAALGAVAVLTNPLTAKGLPL